MASGTPVLTSSTSALQEIAGGYACLVNPMDVDAIAEGISQLATDEKARARFAELGLRRAADFSWDRAASRTLEVYSAAMRGTRDSGLGTRKRG
jgi:alpha-1,3-rhamnosyl/mannosyltransferase